jgi:hypothetical protein
MVYLIPALHVLLVRDDLLLLLVLMSQNRVLAMLDCCWRLLRVLLDLYLAREERVILGYLVYRWGRMAVRSLITSASDRCRIIGYAVRQLRLPQDLPSILLYL